MTSDVPSVFDKIRQHHGREVMEEARKFQWRFTTLQTDYEVLHQIKEMDIPPATERTQQLRTQGYVFEFERRLHHYLSGLYTLVQQQETLQSGIGESYEDELSEIEGDYRSLETSRTVLGLRHYVQHENVLPLQVRTSEIDKSSSLVILLRDLHREGRDDFEAHFGHVEGQYLDPIEWVERDWSNVEDFYRQTLHVIQNQNEEEMEELQKLNQEVDELYDEIREDYLELHNEDST